jgi:GNAT superfamily N-acetyltransferase
MTIELAAAADIPTLAALAGELGYPSTAAQIASRLEAIPDDHRVWVARAEIGVVGWIHAYVARHLVLDPYVEIGGLVVADGARGRGIGPRLIDQACEWARALGCDRVGVHSNVVREDAHRFYEREGFVLEKRQGVFTRRIAAP